MTSETANDDRRESDGSQDGMNTDGVSMLNILRDSLARQGKTTLIQRLTICGRTQQGREMDLTVVFQRFHKQNSNETDNVTGFFMTRPTAWLHIIEAPAHIIRKFMKLLSNPTDSIHTKDIRILDFNEDIPERLFPVWFAKDITTKNSREMNDDRLFEESNICETIINVCDGLLKMGKELSSVSSIGLRVALDDVADTYKDVLPSGKVLIELSGSEFILDVSDFLEFYESKPKYSLERDIVWPVPRPILSI